MDELCPATYFAVIRGILQCELISLTVTQSQEAL